MGGWLCVECSIDYLREASGVEKWFVALHVDVPLCWAQSGNFGNAVGAGEAIVAGENHVDVVGCAEVDNAIVFGSNNDVVGGYRK